MLRPPKTLRRTLALAKKAAKPRADVTSPGPPMVTWWRWQRCSFPARTVKCGACGPPGSECANDRLGWSRPKARTIECMKKEIQNTNNYA